MQQVIEATQKYMVDVKESNVALQDVSNHFQDFFDMIRCTPMTAEQLSPVLDIVFKIYQMTHWIRKLTAGVVLKYILETYGTKYPEIQSGIREHAVEYLKSDKREVRDISAQILACLNAEQFTRVLDELNLNEKDDYTYRESVSQMIGYRLARTQVEQSRLLDILEQNLKFESSQTNVNYVHWYTARALTKLLCALKQNQAPHKVLELAKLSFTIPEMKVRRSAAEAAACYFTTTESGLDELITDLQALEAHQYPKDVDLQVHALLQATSIAVQLLTGTHVSLRVDAIKASPEKMKKLTTLIQQTYERLPDEVATRSLNGLYKNALSIGMLPSGNQVKQMLDSDYVLLLDGGINASIYMQRFHQQSNAEYKKQLLLLCCYSSKAIAVLALRALYFDRIWNGEQINVNQLDFNDVEQQDMINFCLEKSKSKNNEIRACAVNLIRWYLRQTERKLTDDEASVAAQTALNVFSAKKADSASQKAACELLATLALQLKEEQSAQIREAIEPYVADRDDCAGAAAKYFAVTGNKQWCQFVLIYAFDGVNLSLSESCKLSAPLAAKYFDEPLMLEAIEQIADDDILVLNGLTRLFHALKYSCGCEISEKLIQKAGEILVRAGEDFFPEVRAIYDSYLKALTSVADVSGYQLKIDDKLEFDEEADKTSQYLAKQWMNNKNKGGSLLSVITSSHTEMTNEISQLCKDLILQTTVQVELKQLLVGALLGCAQLLPEEHLVDVKKNEVFDFKKINGE